MPPIGVRGPEGPPPAHPTNNKNTMITQCKKIQQDQDKYLFILVFI